MCVLRVYLNCCRFSLALHWRPEVLLHLWLNCLFDCCFLCAGWFPDVPWFFVVGVLALVLARIADLVELLSEMLLDTLRDALGNNTRILQLSGQRHHIVFGNHTHRKCRWRLGSRTTDENTSPVLLVSYSFGMSLAFLQIPVLVVVYWVSTCEPEPSSCGL